ncbi:hypothetical protein H7K05_10385 [Priestia aryabhattai]|uniref:KAP family P-loop NTPase fold protein n=1 Tax=Priestia TaxID=2800373 RepID=UPI001C8EE0C4|nr:MULTISPECIES: P-loop NTPase fold protein [Priestia]MBY0005732.1 hypothetical protein [Priestia aryabhattai]MBY0047587.1 hypothetical protein [Priestia aryabhattai]MDH3186674.1 P-loop NTPase fold protein [Priestia megaterium]
MFNTIVDKVKYILLVVSLLFIGIILAEETLFKLNISTSNIKNFWGNNWFVFPFLIVLLLICIDEIRRRKTINKLFTYPPFTFKVDSWVIIVLTTMLAYWCAVKIGFAIGVFITKGSILFYIIFWSGIAYCLGILIRFFLIKRRNNKSIKDNLLYLDQPILQVSEDRLYRSSFVNRLSKIIKNRNNEESIVISLYGKWGEGKTSVINLMKNTFEDEQKAVIVSFNPWYFENEAQLILQFFNRLISEIEKSFIGEKSELIKELREYSLSLAPITLRTGFLSFSFKEIVGKIKKNEDIFDLRENIEKRLKGEARPIVVLIDDLDRLDKKEIQSVFKLVKLIADFPYITYVLAFDEKIVSTALSEQYGENDSIEWGHSFLDKIVQVPLYLPPADQLDIKNILLEGVDEVLKTNNIEISKQEVQRFHSIWGSSIGKMPLTIRGVKRYLNSVVFSIPLLKDEVNIVDMLCMEGLRIFLSDVHRFIYENSTAFLTAGRTTGIDIEDISKKYRPLFDNLFNNFTIEEKEIVINLMEELFPRSKYLIKGNYSYGSEWDKKWANEQRICSEDYFDRYFVYSVPNGQISDVKFRALLSLIEEGDSNLITDSIVSLAKKRGFLKLIRKFRLLEDEFSEESAKNLMLCLSKLGKNLHTHDGFFGIQNTMTQTAILFSRLIRLLPKKDQLEFSKIIISRAEPLKFSMEIFRWMQPHKNNDDNLFTEDQIKDVAVKLVNRIRNEEKNSDILEIYSSDLYTFLWIWKTWGSYKEVQEVIRKWFKREKGIEKFLTAIIGKSYEITTGTEVGNNFESRHYESIQELIPPEEIAIILMTRYTPPKSQNDYYLAEELHVFKKVAIQFLWIHGQRNNL